MFFPLGWRKRGDVSRMVAFGSVLIVIICRVIVFLLPAAEGPAPIHESPISMSDRSGVLIAVLSSTFGGTAAAVTRFAIGASDPVALAAFRFGIGFLLLGPLALLLKSRLPRGRDWVGAGLLGVMFFAIFFVFHNTALGFTTTARGALALSTLPLWTMVIAVLLGAEPLTPRKSGGVLIAVSGVTVALIAGLGSAPAGAWRGDLIMVAATLCMAF